jgi:rhomboid protease GluP
LIGINVVIFILQYISTVALGGDLLAAVGEKSNSMIIQGQFWRLFTPMFLHASILHIGFNMYALYILGRGLERFYGHGRFLVLYLLSGFCGNVLSFLFAAAPSLGASTAIFGLLGAEGVFLYQNRELFGNNAQRALMNVVMIAAINLIFGLSPGIDNWGHIGGLVGGTIFAWYAGPMLRVQGSYTDATLVDLPETRDLLIATIGVGLLFAILAGVKIFQG